MSTEMIRVFAGRPPIVVVEKCRVYVSVHDEYYRRTRLAYLRKIKLTHADARLNTVAFRASEVPAHVRKSSGLRVVAHKRKSYSQHKKLSDTSFIAVNKAYETWLKTEDAWYASVGLTPPSGVFDTAVPLLDGDEPVKPVKQRTEVMGTRGVKHPKVCLCGCGGALPEWRGGRHKTPWYLENHSQASIRDGRRPVGPPFPPGYVPREHRAA